MGVCLTLRPCSVVIEAGLHTTSLRIATQDQLSLPKAKLADL